MTKSHKLVQRITQIVLIVLMILLCLIVLFPLFFIIVTSFRSDKDVMMNGYQIFPKINIFGGEATANSYSGFTLESYYKVLVASAAQPVMKWFVNSFVVAVISTVLTVFIDALAAYGYARMKFKGRDLIFTALMFTMMIPSVINLIPTYSIVSNLGLKNSIWALILPGLGGVGSIFLIRQFMYTVPKQLDEAASIDGAGHIRIFFSVILPQLVPVLVTVGLFTFLGSWNDLLWPLIVMTEPEKRTLTAGLSVLQGEYANEYASLMAATVVSAVPVMIIYLFAQKYLLQGISLTSGIKD